MNICDNRNTGQFSFCGNNLCESTAESYENCPKDCSGEDSNYVSDLKVDERVEDSFCSQFDGNREACYAHPDKCNWIQKDGVCDNLNVKEIVEKERIVKDTKNPEEKSFFGKIIDWLGGLFR